MRTPAATPPAAASDRSSEDRAPSSLWTSGSDVVAPAESPPRVPGAPPELKLKFNLATLTASAFRHRKSNVDVRLYDEPDMEGWAVRRSKFGAKRADYYLKLQGSDLSVTRRPRRVAAAAEAAAATADCDATHTESDVAASARPTRTIPHSRRAHGDAHHRIQLHVRSDQVHVDRDRWELVFVRRGRERPVRLHLKTQECCLRWYDAVHAALTCHIDQFYTLGDPLGRGAYGEVVLATDVKTKQKCAVKIVKRGTSAKSIQHLTRELEVMRTISHPGIVQTYKIFAGRTVHMVMEYVPGGDLFDFVAQQETLTEAQSSDTMACIFNAVGYLHSCNIVHRDLKPENILCINKSWPLHTKITDFGFSTVLDPDGDINMRTPVGTAYFMAPEIVKNEGHGPPVDLWACGVILYTILTGRLPFPGRNRGEYFKNVAQGKALYPPSLWKGISEDALNLVKGLLSRDQKKRLTALGALQHNWIASASEYAPTIGIKRNRGNLHSRRRRLYKARSAIIAVAMAQKFRATGFINLVEKIPEVVDKVGDQTKNFAHKTADNFMDAGDRLGEGTRKFAENVGEGTRKLKENVGEGTRKLKENVGEGVKKTSRGMKEEARKVGEGVKKTGDAIGTGAKKAADGIGNGVRKTKEGIDKSAKKTKDVVGIGVKKTTEGMKKTGEGIKKGAEKVKIEKLKVPLESLRPKFGGSQADSANVRKRERDIFRRKARAAAAPDEDGNDICAAGNERRFVELGEDGVGRVREEDGASAHAVETEKGVAAGGEGNIDGHLGDSGGAAARFPAEGALKRSEEEVMATKRGLDSLARVIGASMEKQVSRVSNCSAGLSADHVDHAVIKHVSNVSSASATGGDVEKQASNVSGDPTRETDIKQSSQISSTDPSREAVVKHSSQVSSASASGDAADGSRVTGAVDARTTVRLRPKLAPLLFAMDTGNTGHGAPSGDPFGVAPDSGSSDNDDYGTGTHKLRKTAALLLASPDANAGLGANELSALRVPKLGIVDPPTTSTIDSP